MRHANNGGTCVSVVKNLSRSENSCGEESLDRIVNLLERESSWTLRVTIFVKRERHGSLRTEMDLLRLLVQSIGSWN